MGFGLLASIFLLKHYKRFNLDTLIKVGEGNGILVVDNECLFQGPTNLVLYILQILLCPIAFLTLQVLVVGEEKRRLQMILVEELGDYKLCKVVRVRCPDPYVERCKEFEQKVSHMWSKEYGVVRFILQLVWIGSEEMGMGGNKLLWHTLKQSEVKI